MKTFTAKTYIKHIKNVMVLDDALDPRSTPHSDSHPVVIRGRKSENLLKAHKLMDGNGCYTDNKHPAKKKALEWYYKNC